MLSGRAMRMVTYVYHALLKDIERYHEIDLTKTRNKFFKRIDAEGFGFVSKTLPNLGKALDAVLTGQRWVLPRNFRQKGPKDVRPALFFELFELVLDSEGNEIKEPSIAAVKDIRQVAGLFYKYEIPFDEETVERAWNDLCATDTSLGKPSLSGDINKVIDLSRILLKELLCDLDPRSGIPGHGPGAVVEGLDNWEKSQFDDSPTKKALSYFGWKYFFHNDNDIVRSTSPHGKRTLYGSNVEPVSRFCCVPKDSRGPRTICKESASNQWIQQGIKNILYQRIEDHPLTRGFVNFTDQTINGRLALWGSDMERDIVTLDMKEASNRITWWLVKELFPSDWVEALDATRSEYIDHKGQKFGPIEMYAPMGSALCFPIESLVHWSLAVSSITLVHGLDINHVLRSVYVYGDDIVLRGVPHQALFPIFTKLRMRFNGNKCCTAGRFRESCGVDAYRGELVNPLRIKKPILSSGSPEVLVAAVAYCDRAYNDGLFCLSRALDEIIRTNWKCRIPIVSENSDVIGYQPAFSKPSVLFTLDQLRFARYNADLQVLQFLGTGTTGRKFKGNTDWCRYRDVLRAHEARVRVDAFTCLFPNPSSEPTHRHSLCMTKKWSSNIVSY